MGLLSPSIPHPRNRQTREKLLQTYVRKQLNNLNQRTTSVSHPYHRIYEHNFFQYEASLDLPGMFEKTRREWQARVARDSLEVQRSKAFQADRFTRRRHSSLAEQAEKLQVCENAGLPRFTNDRKEKKKERCFTSSAFDSIKTRNTPKPLNEGSASFTQGSRLTSFDTQSDPSRFENGSLRIEVPEPGKGEDMLIKPLRDYPENSRDSCSRKDASSAETSLSYEGNHEQLQLTKKVHRPRQMFRVNSNLERSSHGVSDADLESFRNWTAQDKRNHNRNATSNNGLSPISETGVKLNVHVLSPRHEDRERTFNDATLSSKLSPRGYGQPFFQGRPTRNFARVSTSIPAPQRGSTSSRLTRNFRFDQSEEKRGDQQDLIEGKVEKNERPNQRKSSDEDLSRLSAQSWTSIDSEETITESEARLLGLKATLNPKERSDSSYKSRASPSDWDPKVLFGADPDGTILERMSEGDPYSLSTLECCMLLQVGCDITKKLGFNRYEQRRVWMSSDFQSVCWTSKKSGILEDCVLLSQVARVRLVDRSLTIELIDGYILCLMFPSVTSAGLWVRALACLIPLQAQIKAPLCVMTASEKEREEFSLVEDKFCDKHVREYMSVNNYITLCNPTSTPCRLGLKLAFSFSDARMYGFRYIPRKSAHLLLGTRKEIAILKRLNHPNVVKHFEVFEDPAYGGMYTIFEHLSRGCIADSNNLQRMPIFKEAHVRMILMDIVDALLFLHSLRISHGDLRPENILVAPNGSAKLNPIGCIMHDFNLLENGPAHLRYRLGKSSHAFLAPEQCWLTRAPMACKNSTSMDVWGVGALMYALLYGKAPFFGSGDREIQKNICQSTMRFPADTSTSKEAKSLMFQILNDKDPRMRMKMTEVRSHPWFSESILIRGGSSNSRQTFSDLSDSSGSISQLSSVSKEEIENAIQPAKVCVTAKKRRGTERSVHRQR